MLSPSQEDITRRWSFYPRFKAPVSIEQDKSPAVLTAAPYKSWTHQHIAEADNSAKMMKRDLEFHFLFHADLQRVMIQA